MTDYSVHADLNADGGGRRRPRGSVLNHNGDQPPEAEQISSERARNRGVLGVPVRPGDGDVPRAAGGTTSLGRWMTRDPAGYGMGESRQYVVSTPLTRTDSSGLTSKRHSPPANRRVGNIQLYAVFSETWTVPEGDRAGSGLGPPHRISRCWHAFRGDRINIAGHTGPVTEVPKKVH